MPAGLLIICSTTEYQYMLVFHMNCDTFRIQSFVKAVTFNAKIHMATTGATICPKIHMPLLQSKFTQNTTGMYVHEVHNKPLQVSISKIYYHDW